MSYIRTQTEKKIHEYTRKPIFLKRIQTNYQIQKSTNNLNIRMQNHAVCSNSNIFQHTVNYDKLLIKSIVLKMKNYNYTEPNTLEMTFTYDNRDVFHSN